MQLEGKRAIVTGGGSGIGRAIARGLARAGAVVVIADIDLPAGQRVVQEIEAEGGQALVSETDVTVREQVERMVAFVVERLGGVDILINDVGGQLKGDVLNVSEEDWDYVVAQNLKSTFICSKTILPHMIAQGGGRIVNIASARGIYNNPGGASYGAAKAGVINFTRSLAQEVAQYSITVNAIAPGMTDTPAVQRSFEPAALEHLRRSGQIGQPEDLVSTVVFLCSPAAQMITGALVNREVFMPRGGP